MHKLIAEGSHGSCNIRKYLSKRNPGMHTLDHPDFIFLQVHQIHAVKQRSCLHQITLLLAACHLIFQTEVQQTCLENPEAGNT